MTEWTDPAWLADVEGWIRAELSRLGAKVTGPMEDCVPELLAVDLECGWMLQADGGTRLRELVEGERDLHRWLEVLPRYAVLQLDMTEHRDQLLALGVPDRRLASLPAQFERLVEETGGLTGDELRRLRELVPWVRATCEELAGCGVPETIQHDDFHDGQVFVRDGRYLFFDWGDACVSHPFLTMAVTLEGVIAWGLDDVEGSVDVGPFRDAYLEPFTRYRPREELVAACEAAIRLGWICRALLNRLVVGGLEPPDAEEHADAVPVRLRMFLEGAP